MKLDKSHVGKVVRIENTVVVEVPDGVFAPGDIVIMFNNTDKFMTIQSRVPTTYVSARAKPRTVIEFPPKALTNMLMLDDKTAVFSGEVA